MYILLILLIVVDWYFMDLYGNWAARYRIHRCRCSMTPPCHSFPRSRCVIHECLYTLMITNVAFWIWQTMFDILHFHPHGPQNHSAKVYSNPRLRLFFVRWEMKDVPLGSSTHCDLFVFPLWKHMPLACRVTFPDLCLVCVWLAIHQTCQTCQTIISYMWFPYIHHG